MKNTIEQIKRTQDLIQRFSENGSSSAGWRYFQKRFGKSASSKYSAARIADRIKEFDKDAAEKGFVVTKEGEACALWLCPCTEMSVYSDGTTASASAMNRRANQKIKTKTNRDGFWMFTRQNGEQVVYC